METKQEVERFCCLDDGDQLHIFDCKTSEILKSEPQIAGINAKNKKEKYIRLAEEMSRADSMYNRLEVSY